MRIDTHSHVMLRPLFGRPATDVEKLLADWAECGLDGGWVSSIDAILCSELDGQKRIHDELAEQVRRFPGRLWGMCTVNPGAMEQAAREVERCVKDLGFIGVKIHPPLQAVSVVANPGMDLIMQAAAELGVCVLFHDGTPPYSTPRQIGFLAGKHPRTTVVLGHCGIADLWRDAADVGRLCENVWLQPTAVPKFVIRSALDAVGSGRMLFGTDSGFGSAHFVRYCVSKFREALGDDLAEQIIAENPAKFLASCRA